MSSSPVEIIRRVNKCFYLTLNTSAFIYFVAPLFFFISKYPYTNHHHWNLNVPISHIVKPRMIVVY